MNLAELDIKHRLATGARTFEEFCKVIELLDAPATIEWFSYVDMRWHLLKPWKGTFVDAIEYVESQVSVPSHPHGYLVLIADSVIRERSAQ